MVFKPTLNITEQIADHLADLVISGELPGGARIQELKIANELGVSRGSVREALLILERRHLIEIVPRKGAMVNQISAQEALDLVDMLASVEHRWFHSLICTGADDNLAAAGNFLMSMDRAAKSGSVTEIIQARGAFYAELLRPATRYMNGVFECLLPTSQRLVCVLVGRADVDLHDIARYYRALHTALQQRDAQRLDELLNGFHKRLHLLCSRTFGAKSATKSRSGNLSWAGLPLAAASPTV